MKIVVVSPHRDDAAFSLGLAIETWLDAGHTVDVMNCYTRSEYSPFGDNVAVHPNDRRTYVMALRLREDELWRRHYGKGLSLSDLNLKDGPQRMRCTIDEVCTRLVNPEDNTMPKIRESLGKRRPDALILPLALGNHVDHATARDAAAFAQGSELPLGFYEDLPYASRPGAAELIEERVQEMAAGIGAPLLPVFARPAQEIEMAVRRKRRLALCYDSQIDGEVTEAIARFCERYDGRERMWVNQAWRESALGKAETAELVAGQ